MKFYRRYFYLEAGPEMVSWFNTLIVSIDNILSAFVLTLKVFKVIFYSNPKELLVRSVEPKVHLNKKLPY